MDAAIVTIGDEILIGQIIDTNSAWLGDTLSRSGVRVCEVRSIADTPQAIEKNLTELLDTYPLVITTGGIGPTKDDLTKHTLARLFGMGLVRCEAVYAQVEQMLAKRGIPFNELNQSQALVPDGCEVLVNRCGTAPGMWFERDGAVLVSMPGVPFEMKCIVQEQLLPRLRERFSLQENTHITALTFGLAESVLAERIAPWEEALPEALKLAYLPSPLGVRLRLSAYNMQSEEALSQIQAQFTRLEPLIGEHLVGYGDPSLEGVVAQMLLSRGESLAVAESCTGGNIAHRITLQSGSSAYFRGGVVSYANSVKEGVLGVDSALLEQYGAVSAPVAEAMAEGVRRITGADYGLSTTGVAGPDGGSDEKPVGTVWMALSSAEGVRSFQMHFGAMRLQNIERFSSGALNLLRLHLREKMQQ